MKYRCMKCGKNLEEKEINIEIPEPKKYSDIKYWISKCCGVSVEALFEDELTT